MKMLRVLAPNGGTIPVNIQRKETLKSIVQKTIDTLDNFKSELNKINNMVDKILLDSKEFYYTEFTNRAKSANGNLDRISDNVFKFTQYNFLSAEDNESQLDGHYTFYVNVETFQWCLYKSSYYGGLTYTTESNNTNLLTKLDLNEYTIKVVEAIIADKLLGAYFYNSNDVNGKGKNLIDPNVNDIKRSIVCDWRGYIWSEFKINQKSDKDVEALKLIDLNHINKTTSDIEIKYLKQKKFELVQSEYPLNGKTKKEPQFLTVKTFVWNYLIQIDNVKFNLIITKDDKFTINNSACLINIDSNPNEEIGRCYGKEFNLKQYQKAIKQIYISRYC